ncbi:MAG TPA: hypothetical protein VF649_11880 [Sphingomonas sp.]|jgi:uncharacterized protein involved in exopolysaccharide biosynthesis|uniref:hypothetical protein n=1 Tax=Sphingomonas sp. TaxID=28214 RepID=UPI002ED8BC3C
MTGSLGMDYVRLVLSRWKLVTGLVLGCTLFAWAFSVFVLAQRPTFEGAARLNIVPTGEELGYASRFVRGSTFDGGSVLLQTYAEYAHTRPIVAPIIDRYIDWQARQAQQPRAQWVAEHSVPPAFSPGRILAFLNYGEVPVVPLPDDLLDNLVKNTTIESVEGTYLLRVTVAWDDPESAAWFANALSESIVDQADVMSRESGVQIAGSLQSRLAAKEAALAALVRRSRQMKVSLGVIDLDRQRQSLMEEQVSEQTRLTGDRAQLTSSEQQIADLRRQAGGKLSATQQAVEQSLAIEAPKAAGLRGGIAIRERRVAQLGAQLATLGTHDVAVKALDDDIAAMQREVTGLVERIGFSQTENLANAPRIRLIEKAVPPRTRSSPKLLLNTALGFVGGCALAGCALLLLGAAPKRAAPDTPQPSDDADAGAGADHSAAVAALRPAGKPQRERRAPAYASIGSAALAIVPDAPPAEAASLTGSVVLPRPRDGIAYDAAEVAGLAPAVAAWLAVPLAETTPLVIAAISHDREARLLFQLIHGHLKAQGQPIWTIDGTARPIDPRWQHHPKRLLVYGGGFGESGRLTLLRDAPGTIVLAVAAGDDAAGSAEFGDSVRTISGHPPYVAQIER